MWKLTSSSLPGDHPASFVAASYLAISLPRFQSPYSALQSEMYACVTAYETDAMKRLSMQVMNSNLWPKKCSGQSRYGRYGSHATEFIFATMDGNSRILILDFLEIANSFAGTNAIQVILFV